ncbi:MAG: multiheme c-type cytochrome [Pirellulaceae bacterium]
MTRKFLYFGLLSAMTMAVLYVATENDGENVDVEALAIREHRRLESQAKTNPETSDLDLQLANLAKRGRGLPLPSHLQVRRDAGGAYIVVQPGQEVGAVLPFPPGQYPAAPSVKPPLDENPGFLGAASCAECHSETFESFSKTAHHLTSQPATTQSILGSFAAQNNTLQTFHPDVSFEMVQTDGIAVQRTSFLDWKFDIPMQLIFGSGKIAQSYLYWHGDELYQCSVTYLSGSQSWINSPGYHDGDADYDRPIKSRCLECHATYVDLRAPSNHYTPGSLIAGISCERCHGPGRDHVQYHQANPNSKSARFVTVPSDLPRQRELDVCSQCHSSTTPNKGEPFAFRPGDEFKDHYEEPTGEGGQTVHTSNQLERLSRSKCFEATEMTCVDCHNPHQQERGNLALFSDRCMKCHQPNTCGMFDEIGDSINQNCIDCHMPVAETKNLRMSTAQGNVFPPLRDHYIHANRDVADAHLLQKANGDTRALDK